MVAVEEEVVVAVARDLRREGRHWRLPRSCSCFAWLPRALETAGRAISLTRELAAVERTRSTPLEAAAVVAVVVEEEAVAAVAVAAVAASVAVAAVAAVVLAVLVACA